MTWSNKWEDVFKATEWGRYPAEPLVRFIASNFYQSSDRSAVRILELGCGPGANIWYMAREGFTVDGIDGSPEAIRIAKERLAQEGGYPGNLQVGDIINLDKTYEAETFDAVVDIHCLQCLIYENILKTMDQVHKVLKPGGRVFSMTLATESWGEGMGVEIAPGTWSQIPEGPNSDSEINHFHSKEDIEQLYQQFSDLKVEWQKRSFIECQRELRHWVVEARKAD